LIRKRYWATGIRIEYTDHHNPAWGGEVDFYDDTLPGRDESWANGDQGSEQGQISTHGHLQTRYFVPSRGSHRDALTAVTDSLINDAEQLGIAFRDPTLYATGEGLEPDYPMPEGWIELLEEQADRLGWTRPPYRSVTDRSGRPRLRVLD
jgi:hypothetical protein